MVRDQAHDPLAVCCGQHPPAILEPARQPVDPKPTIGVEHHLDDGWVFEEGLRREPCAQDFDLSAPECADQVLGEDDSLRPALGKSLLDELLCSPLHRVAAFGSVSSVSGPNSLAFSPSRVTPSRRR